MTPTCSAHGAPIIAPCARCGVFLCALETHALDGATYCETCIARPEVDVVSAYRRYFWGRRRDPWSWIYGAGALFSLTTMGRLLASPNRPPYFGIIALVSLVFVAVQLAWFTRQRWARIALPAVYSTTALLWLALSTGRELWDRGPVVLLLCSSLVAAHTSVPSRLFFKIELPRETLSTGWRRYHRNAIAYVSVLFALAGYWYPWLFLTASMCGLVAFLRTWGKSLPPARGKWFALAGLIVGANGFAAQLLLHFDR